MSQKQNIYDLSLCELRDWVAENGFKPYTAVQLVQWLYEKRVDSFEAMTNISKLSRAGLCESFEMHGLAMKAVHSSGDGSVKLAYELNDGLLIESVLMPQQDRMTLCVSSQVGCAMGCVFCKTAEMKLKRNLSQGEILGQVLAAMHFLEKNGSEGETLKRTSGRERISNVVFMGMGEPFHNFAAVLESVRILLDERAFNFAKRKVTVSTAGLAPEIVQFGKEVPARLAVSLNAANDSLRETLMPINRRCDLEAVIEACREYARLTSDAVTFEYVLIRDVNDSQKDAADLVRLVAQTPCKINLIPFNEYAGSPYRRPEDETIRAFHQYLADRGFRVNIRYSKGSDVLAACGQLATALEKKVA